MTIDYQDAIGRGPPPPQWVVSNRPRIDSVRPTIVIATDGGAIRTVITGRKRGMVSVLPSFKTGRPQPAESWGEAQLIRECEADTNVVDYQAQPHRLEFLNGAGKRITYIPDMARKLEDGSVEVIEVKACYVVGKMPRYDLKLSTAAAIYNQLGWRFRLVRGRDLNARPEWSANCSAVAQAGTTHVTSAEIITVENLLALAGGSIPLEELALQLGPKQLGLKKLLALHVRRVISIDLSSAFSKDTMVQFAKPSAYKLHQDISR